MKQSINKVTGLPVGYTTEWVVLDNGEWRVLTVDETDKATALYDAELLAKEALEAMNTWKSNRQTQVDNIEVTWDGTIYQGDEVSQGRMCRAILALPDDTTTTLWIAKDNTPTQLNRLDLASILRLAGEAHTALWTA